MADINKRLGKENEENRSWEDEKMRGRKREGGMRKSEYGVLNLLPIIIGKLPSVGSSHLTAPVDTIESVDRRQTR